MAHLYVSVNDPVICGPETAINKRKWIQIMR